MASVSNSPAGFNWDLLRRTWEQPDEPPVPDVFAPDFEGFPDELPLAVSDHCPGDRVVHAEHWQGTLDSPAADDDGYIPTTADLLDYELWSERLEVERECNARFC